MSNRLTFDLDEGMLKAIGGEFAADKIASQFSDALATQGQKQLENLAQEIFGDYGVQWMKRSRELGEHYSDSTYEMLKKAIEKTGVMYFPLVPQRFVEIAYLSVMSFLTLSVVQNNGEKLAYKLTACDIYENIKRQCGTDVASLLPCRYACLSALNTLFQDLNIKVTISMEATMPKNGYCQFCASR